MSSLKPHVAAPRKQPVTSARPYARHMLLLCLIGAIGLLGTLTLARAATGLVATKTFAFIGGDGDGKADPGETIAYTVQITNTSGADLASLVLSDTVDVNTTLLAGSVNVSPLALDDSYETIGNTLLEVGGAAGPAPAVRVAGSLFSNDREFLGETGTFTITAHTEPTHGSLAAFDSAAGTFRYLPTAGYSGPDSFTYTLRDAGGLADTATVTINVNSARVWYVGNTAAPAGMGRSSDPFDTLAEAQAASSSGDTIYIFYGDGTTTGQNAGIVLKDTQRLLGEGVALTVPVGVNGGASPTTLRAAGSQPRVGNAAGNGVAATDAVPAEIRGLSLSGSANAIDISLTSAGTGTLAIKDNTIFGAGAEGIDINQSSSGALTLDVQNNTWNTAGTHTGNAFDARTIAGALNLNVGNNTNILASATGVLLDGSGGGTLTVTGFANNSIHRNTAGAGVSANTVTFDVTPGGGFQTVAGGITTLGTSGDGVGGAGMLLTSVKGDLSFTDLDIVADSGAGLQAGSAGAFNAGSGTGFRIAVDAGFSTITANGGAAVDLNTVTAALPFATISSSNSTGAGVALSTLLGTFSAGTSSAISNAAGTDFSVSGSNATITYSGSITDSSGAGVALSSNTGSTITFNGSLTISSGASAAFAATGGGTVHVCDDNPCNPAATGSVVNTLASTTGTALNIANTTIGSNNLEFKSISANGAASGIVLNSTGSSGGLVVKGDSGSGNNGSGGTIQSTTGHGIALAGTQSVVLDQMTIQNTGGSGVNGTGVTNFTFTNGTISNVGDALGESNIAFNGNGTLTGNNFSGALTITGSTLSNAFDHGIHVEGNDGTISNAVIQNNTFTSSTSATSSKGSAIQLIGTGTASTVGKLTKATISNNTIANFPSGAGIQVNFSNANASGPGTTAGVAGSGANVVTISNNTLNGGASKFGTSAILFVVSGANPGQRGSGNVNISSNNAQNSLGTTIGIGNNGSVDMTGVVDGNTVVANNAFASNGIGGGNGVSAGGGAETPYLTLTVTNNTISQTDGNGILLVGRGTAGQANFGIRNNTVAAPLTGVRPGIRVDAGNATAGSDDAVCLDVSGNASAGSGGSQGIGLRKQGTVATTHDFGIEGMAATGTPGVESYVNGLNPAGSGTLLISATSGFANCSTTAVVPMDGPAMARQHASGAPIGAVDGTGFQPAAAINTGDINPAWFQQTAYSPAQNAAAVAPARVSDAARSAPARAAAPAPAAAGETLNVALGTLPAGKRIIVTFRATVNDPLALGTTQIANQGVVSGSNFADVLTDDPAVAGSSDPTVLPIDRPDTTVTSLNRASGNPTKNATVTWQVVFADPVDGLTASNFSLSQGGSVSGASIAGVTEASGPPATTWNITASTGSGDGTLGLRLANDTGLSHDLTNLAFSGQEFTIDKTAPTLLNVTSSTADGYYNAPDTISIQVRFSEPVDVSGTPQLTLETGATDAAADYTDGSGSDTLTFTYTVANGQNASDLDYIGTGALALNGGTLQDTALNNAGLTLPAPGAAGSLGANKALVIDTTAPTVVAFTRETPAGQLTNANTLVFRVTFSEPVGYFAGGVGTSDFVVHDNSPAATTTASVSGVGVVSPNGPFTVSVGGGDLAGFEGDVGLDFSNTAVIMDQAGNALVPAEPTTDQIYTLDNTPPPAPVVTSPANGSSTSNSTPTVGGTAESGSTVTVYLDAVAAGTATADGSGNWSFTPGAALADGTHTVMATATDAAGNTSVNSNANRFTVDTLPPPAPVVRSPANGSSTSNSTPTAGGTAEADSTVTVYLDNVSVGTTAADSSGNWLFTPPAALSDGAHTVKARALDAAGNSSVDSNTNTFVVDTSAPDTTIVSSPANPTNSTSASFGFTGSDGSGSGVAGFECRLDGGAFVACTSPQSYSGLADGSHTFQVRALDSVGNTDATLASFTWTVDTAAPTAVISSSVTGATNSAPIPVTITFSEPITGFGSLAAADDLVVTNGTAGDLVVGSAGSAIYSFSITPAGQGAVTVQLKVGSVLDQAGNANTAGSNTLSITYDTVAPSVMINQAAGQADPAGSVPIEFTAVFDELVAGLSGASLTLGGTAPGPLSAIVSGGPLTYTVAVSGMTGSGTVTATLAAGAVADLAGNTSAAATSTDNEVLFDPIAPLVTAIVRAAPSPTLDASVPFTITFTKDVTGVDAGDFALTTSGLSGAAISGVAGGGATWVVTATTGTGSGTLRLDLADDDTIRDSADNVLGGAGAGNGSFSGGELYAIDRTAPQVQQLVAADIAVGGGATHTFTIVLSDNLALDVASLDGSDLLVSGPNGFSRPASFASVAPATNGAPRTATYQVAAPGGSWDSADNGSYTVALASGQIYDTVGNAAAGRTLGSFAVNIGPAIRRYYLPMALRPGYADLVVSVSISPNKRSFTAGEPVVLAVTVTNQGDVPAGAFWIDGYLNPSSPPDGANQLWNTRCGMTPCFGLVWQVPGGLAPGASVTLTSQSLPAGYSYWPGWLAAGTTDLYVYVDSFNPGVAAGAVAESNEGNNRAELHGLHIAGTNPQLVRPAYASRSR